MSEDACVAGSFQPSIRGHAAAGWAQSAERHGAEPARVLREAGVAQAPGPAGRMPLAAYCALFEAAARHTGVETFGLRFGLARHRQILGPLGDRARAAPTLGAGLADIARYLPLVQEQSAITLGRRGGMAALTYGVRDGRIIARRQDAELTLGALVGVMRAALGPHWSPADILLEDVRPARATTHRELLGAPVQFAAGANAILFPAVLLAVRMPRAVADSVAAPRAGAFAHAAGPVREEFLGVVRQAIRASLHVGDPTLAQVARAHGMSEPTLYRRLRARGVSFGALVTDVRREMALHWLDQPHVPLTEIARLLGYAELSVFSRAFRRWTGVSPGAYRRAPRFETTP